MCSSLSPHKLCQLFPQVAVAGTRSDRNCSEGLQLLYHTSTSKYAGWGKALPSLQVSNHKYEKEQPWWFWFEAVYCLFTINKADKEMLTYIPYLLLNLKCRTYIRLPQVIKNPSTCSILSWNNLPVGALLLGHICRWIKRIVLNVIQFLSQLL